MIPAAPVKCDGRLLILGSVPNLEGLLLNENQIEEISADLLGLGKLKTLWFHGNRLRRVDNLRSCRNLVHLDLSRNLLSGVASQVPFAPPQLA